MTFLLVDDKNGGKMLVRKKTTILVQLPTELSYWGATATESDVSRILDNLESMIRSEFGDKFTLNFERTQNPRGTGVHSADEDAATDMWEWIRDNWQFAL